MKLLHSFDMRHALIKCFELYIHGRAQFDSQKRNQASPHEEKEPEAGRPGYAVAEEHDDFVQPSFQILLIHNTIAVHVKHHRLGHVSLNLIPLDVNVSEEQENAQGEA